MRRCFVVVVAAGEQRQSAGQDVALYVPDCVHGVPRVLLVDLRQRIQLHDAADRDSAAGLVKRLPIFVTEHQLYWEYRLSNSMDVVVVMIENAYESTVLSAIARKLCNY
jgi:hypothetical protein